MKLINDLLDDKESYIINSDRDYVLFALFIDIQMNLVINYLNVMRIIHEKKKLEFDTLLIKKPLDLFNSENY